MSSGWVIDKGLRHTGEKPLPRSGGKPRSMPAAAHFYNIKSSNHLKARNIRVTEFTTISFLHRLRLQCSEKVKVVQMMIFQN